MNGRVRSISIDTLIQGQGSPGQETVAREFYRLDSRQRRVLVIGSPGQHAASSVGWLDEWPSLADYDVVIINLKSLDHAALVKLSRQDKDRLKRMRLQLYDLLMSRGEIYCLMAPFLAFGSTIYYPDGNSEPEWSNLSWSPIGVSIIEIRGETVHLEGEKKFESYLRQVAGWDGYINATASLYFIEERLKEEGQLGEGEEVFWQQMPLAMNRFGKPLAASVCFGVRVYEENRQDYKIKFISDYLHLLPPPTKISLEKGIDLLIEEAKGLPARTITPDWADLYALPGEDHLQQKINEAQKMMRAAEREQKRHFQAYRELLRTRALLYEHGQNLKHVVKDVLQRMGFACKVYPALGDLLVLGTRQGRMLLDVVGRSGPAHAGDLQLLLRHAVYAQEEDGKIWKGLLVFNHFRLNDPASDRPAPFGAEVTAMAREMRLGLISAEGLYGAFCLVMQGSMLKEELENRLHQQTGWIQLPAVDIKRSQQDLGFLPETLGSGGKA